MTPEQRRQSAKDKERAEAERRLEAEKAAKRAELRAILEDAGWSSVTVKAIGAFIAIGGIDPQGNARSGCRADGETLVETLLALGVVLKPRVAKPEPETLTLPIRSTVNGIPSSVVFSPAPDAELAAARQRIAELEAREPEVRIVEKIVERVVEVPAPVVEEVAAEPYTPDFTLIPDALAKFAEADETAADFRARLKGLWQRFGIEDGKHFPGGGEPLTGEEKITMREIDIVLNSDEGMNAGLLQWIRAEELNT